jgi:hypothetical protein
LGAKVLRKRVMAVTQLPEKVTSFTLDLTLLKDLTLLSLSFRRGKQSATHQMLICITAVDVLAIAVPSP